MANNQDAAGKFRPFIESDFKPHTYIRSGNDTVHYYKGVRDMAYNNNTLMARAKHPIINQVDSPQTATTIAGTTSPLAFAHYVVWTPSIPGRDTIDVTVTATCPGVRFQVRGVTPAGTGSYSAASSVGGSTVTCVVPVTTGTFQAMTLEFKLSAGGNFLPTKIYSVQTDISTTDIGTTANTRFVPQDSTQQYAIDQPFTVDMVRDLNKTNNNLFSRNIRCVHNWSFWGDWTSVISSNKGISRAYTADTANKVHVSQLYYLPRPGVTRLVVFMAGRTHNYGATAGESWITFDDETFGGGNFTTATTVTTSGSWAVWQSDIDVPTGVTGPLLLNLSMKTPGVGTTTCLQSLSIWEDPNTVKI